MMRLVCNNDTHQSDRKRQVLANAFTPSTILERSCRDHPTLKTSCDGPVSQLGQKEVESLEGDYKRKALTRRHLNGQVYKVGAV
ncbi:hypothetical protein RB195_021323 [Necator americanus]|uniref:Uncharacterized protein n=1 Tax=Necator americanus TaxID=51031 RepID=A0ABR1EAR1_NECAM